MTSLEGLISYLGSGGSCLKHISIFGWFCKKGVCHCLMASYVMLKANGSLCLYCFIFSFRCGRSHICKAGYSFSHFRIFPTGFYLEWVLMRPSWGLSTMVLFRQNHMDYPRDHLRFDLFGGF